MLCAIYCRLSKEDDDHSKESESIQNQKSLLVKYAVEKGWDIYKIYSDEDYSGIDRGRPEFNTMISDARDQKFDIVLCKTQSRFTRDMELVEKYIHNQFLLWGIRFVTVVDNVDTDVKGNKKSRQINGLINEWYLEDLSENIRAVFDHKRRNGQYIGGFPVYGYQKDPADKSHLVVDEYAADIVRQIFAMYLEGDGKQHIAYLLNQRQVPNPTKYKQQNGANYVNAHVVNDYGLWNRTSVGRILKNEMYLGHMVQGRRKKISYKSKQLVNVPKEDWFRVEGTHEAIIDTESFEMVQQLMRTRTRSDGTGETHILSGKVHCADCGSILCKTSHTYKGERRSYLRCKLYATGKSQNLCTKHSIRLDKLTEVVEEKIRGYIKQHYEIGDASRFEVENQSDKKQAKLEKEIQSLRSQIERRSLALKNLYLDKVSGVIDETQFGEMNESFLAEKKSLLKHLEKANAEIAMLDGSKPTNAGIIEKIKGLLECKPMSRNLIALMVDTIEVSEKLPTGEQQININWLI